MGFFINGQLAEQVTTTATAGGTTSLVYNSQQIQVFTGTLGQTVVLPNATTMSNGQWFEIYNSSTGSLTIQYFGGGSFTLYPTILSGGSLVAKLSNNGTTAGTWVVQSGGFTNPMTTAGDIIYENATPAAARLPIGTSGQVLTSTGTLPAWSTPTTTTALPPTVTVLSGSGTFTVPAGALYLTVQMVGGGGGGGGAGTTTETAGGNGGTTTFGTSFLTCTGGIGGGVGPSGGSAGTGGTATIGSGATGQALTGSSGYGATESPSGASGVGGGGGSSFFGGSGLNSENSAGGNAASGTGSGAGGGSTTTALTGYGGGGGGAGGYINATISTPAASYSYSVGSGGTAGTAGTNGYAGGTGGSGTIVVTTYYSSGASTSSLIPPAVTTLTSGSGTYTTPAGALYLTVQMVGGGGGGGGSGTTGYGSGGTGNASTFGTSLLTANGGGGSNASAGGAGGTATISLPATGYTIQGQNGGVGAYTQYANTAWSLGSGGGTFLGGGTAGSTWNTGVAGSTNTGGGGSGGGINQVASSYIGGGGGGGGGINAIITSPAASYSYTVGTGGTAGTAGTSGNAGGAGGSGVIVVTAYFAAGGTTIWGNNKSYLTPYIASTSSNTANSGNGNFELGTTQGWSLAHSALTSFIPTSVASAGTAFSSSNGGTAAAGTLSITATSSSAIAGVYSGNLVSTAASTAGDMLISNAFFIDTEDQAKVMTVKFYYKVVSGTLNLSGSTSNSFAVWVYDVTNGAWIMPAGVYNLIQGTGVGYCTATFQTTSNSTKYQLALVNINATSGAYSLYVDDFSVGPQTAPVGPAMTDSVAFTPTGTFTTNTTYSGFYRRIGETAQITYLLSFSGAPNSTTLSVNLPAGLVIDTTKLPTSSGDGIPLGYGVGIRNGVFQYGITPQYSTTTSFQINYFQTASGTNPVNVGPNSALTQAAPYTIANADSIQFTITVPIAGWSSNTSMSSDTDTRVVAAYGNLQTPTGTISASQNVIKFGTVNKDTHAAYNTSTGLYTVPVTGWYQTNCLIVVNGTYALNENLYLVLQQNGSEVQQGGIYAGGANAAEAVALAACVYCNAGDTLGFYSVTSASGPSYSSGNSQFSINRVCGPAVVAATESVNGLYTDTSGGSIGTSIAAYTYATKIRDTHNAYSGGVLTIPVSGMYMFSANLFTNTVNLSTSQDFVVYIFRNGTQIIQNNAYGNGTATSYNQQATINYPCLAGDTIQVKVICSVATTANTAVGVNTFSWARVGN